MYLDKNLIMYLNISSIVGNSFKPFFIILNL